MALAALTLVDLPTARRRSMKMGALVAVVGLNSVAQQTRAAARAGRIVGHSETANGGSIAMTASGVFRFRLGRHPGGDRAEDAREMALGLRQMTFN